MKKLLAFLLALSLLLSLCACTQENGGENKDKDEDLVTVYLPVTVTEYKADGSRGYRQNFYTYTDEGLPLAWENDHGDAQAVWNEELLVYEYVFGEFDGAVDLSYEYTYNDEGNCVYYESWQLHYDENGELTSKENYVSDKDRNYIYHYDDQGRVDYIDTFDVIPGGGHSEEPTGAYRYCYDDDGNLVEIYWESLEEQKVTWAYDFRYDKEGRLIAFAKHTLDCVYCFRYEYNEDGQLSRVTQWRGSYQAPIDDQHISQSTVPTIEELGLVSELLYEYDDDGNLISRGDTKCTYEDGKLSTVTVPDQDGDKKYVFVDDEKDADSSATTYVRDEKGNIVKIIYSDGTYTELEYKKFRLTEEEALACRNYQMSLRRRSVDATFMISLILGVEGYAGFLNTVPLPYTDLLAFDLIEGY